MSDDTINDVIEFLVPWDDIFRVLRRACPKLGMYGDTGGDTPKILQLVRNDEIIKRVARGVWDARTSLNVANKSDSLKVRAAGRKAYDEAIDALVSSLK